MTLGYRKTWTVSGHRLKLKVLLGNWGATENARLENGAPEMQGRKMREKWPTCVVNAVTKTK